MCAHTRECKNVTTYVQVIKSEEEKLSWKANENVHMSTGLGSILLQKSVATGKS